MRLAMGMAVLAALLVFAPPAAAQEDESNPELERYIEAVEPICQKDAARSERILKGVRRKVMLDYTGVASRQFARAARAFRDTLRRIIAVPRPAEELVQFNTWITSLKGQLVMLRRISRTLLDRQRFKAQRQSIQLLRNARQSNTVVADIEFNHCVLRPNKFL